MFQRLAVLILALPALEAYDHDAAAQRADHVGRVDPTRILGERVWTDGYRIPPNPGGRTLNGRTITGFLSQEQVPFLSEWGLACLVHDIQAGLPAGLPA